MINLFDTYYLMTVIGVIGVMATVLMGSSDYTDQFKNEDNDDESE